MKTGEAGTGIKLNDLLKVTQLANVFEPGQDNLGPESVLLTSKSIYTLSTF